MIVAWAVLLAAGFLGAAAFVVVYAVLDRAWHRSDVGRNLMAMAAVLCGLLGLSLAALFVRIWWPWWLAGMASLDAVLWWRVVLLWQVQRRQEVD